MKRIITAAVSLFIMLSLTVSCEPNKPSGNNGSDIEETLTFVKASGVYFGDDQETGTGRYTITMQTENFYSIGTPSGEGAKIYMEFFGDLFTDVADIDLTGEFSAASNEEGVKNTFVKGYTSTSGVAGTYIKLYTGEGGKNESTVKLVDGTFEIQQTGNKITLAGTLEGEGGEEFEVDFDGTVSFTDQSSGAYYIADGVYCRYYGDLYTKNYIAGSGGYDIFIYKGTGFKYDQEFKGSGWVIYLESFANLDDDPDNPTLPEGDYDVTDAYHMDPFTYCMGFYFGESIVSSSLSVYSNSTLTGKAPLDKGYYTVEHTDEGYKITTYLQTYFDEPVEIVYNGPINFVNASGKHKDNVIDLQDVAGAKYNGDIYENGSGHFIIDLVNSEVGYGLVVDGFGDAASDFKLDGTYTIGDDKADGNLVFGEIDSRSMLHGTYAYEWNTAKGNITKAMLVTGGTMTVSSSGSTYTIKADFTGVNASTGAAENYTATYKGELPFVDNSPLVTYSGTFANAKAVYYGDYAKNGTGNFEIEFYNGTIDANGQFVDSYDILVLDLFSATAADPTNAVIKDGDYYPSFTAAEMSFQPGLYLSETLFPSFFGKSTMSAVLLAKAGKVTIGYDNGNYTMSANLTGETTSRAGAARVKYTYNGPITVTDKSGDESPLVYRSPIPRMREVNDNHMTAIKPRAIGEVVDHFQGNASKAKAR